MNLLWIIKTASKGLKTGESASTYLHRGPWSFFFLIQGSLLRASSHFQECPATNEHVQKVSDKLDKNNKSNQTI